MGRSNAELRERLFNQYSRQADLYGVDAPGIFICPLCRARFTRAALEGPNPSLSLAHVVPQALGGTLRTLTCTPCNNGNGSGLEADLSARLCYRDWSRGAGKVSARVTGDFGHVGTTFSRSPDGARALLEVVHKQSDDAAVRAFFEHLEAGLRNPAGDFRFRVRWSQGYRGCRTLAAVYQSVYLLMFAYFGYDFALHPHYELLREQVQRPDDEVWPGDVSTLMPESAAGILGGREAAVVLVREPVPALAAVLRFRSAGGEELFTAVMLPTPDDPTVPRFEPGNFDCSPAPFAPGSLTVAREWLQFVWMKFREETR